MGIFKKIGKTVKKVAKFAAPIAAAAYAPQAISAIGGFLGGTPLKELGSAGTDTGQWGNGAVSETSPSNWFGSTSGQTGNWNPLIQGGATLLGGMMQNTSSAQQAQKQMDFQSNQTGTAHQREVKDLIAAGLNPILSGTGGGGASSGSGAFGPQTNALGDAVSSAASARSMNEQIQNLRAQTSFTGTQEENSVTEQDNRNKLNQATLKNLQAQTRGSNAQALLSEQEAQRGGLKSKLWGAGNDVADWFSNTGKKLMNLKPSDSKFFSNPELPSWAKGWGSK